MFGVAKFFPVRNHTRAAVRSVEKKGNKCSRTYCMRLLCGWEKEKEINNPCNSCMHAGSCDIGLKKKRKQLNDSCGCCAVEIKRRKQNLFSHNLVRKNFHLTWWVCPCNTLSTKKGNRHPTFLSRSCPGSRLSNRDCDRSFFTRFLPLSCMDAMECTVPLAIVDFIFFPWMSD